MKNKLKSVQTQLIFFFIICLPSLSNAGEFLIEGKAAYFHPTNHRFREIYSGGGIYGLELSFQAHNDLYLFLSGDYFEKAGRSILYDGEKKVPGNRTNIKFAPAGFGVKYLTRVNRIVSCYVSLGALATYLNLKNSLPNKIQQHIKWGPGVTAKIGSLITLHEALFLDLAVDYRYTKVHFNNPPCCAGDLSGFSFGGGLGYRF